MHNVYIDAQLFAELIHFFPQIGNTDRRRRHIRNHHHNKIAGQNGLAYVGNIYIVRKSAELTFAMMPTWSVPETVIITFVVSISVLYLQEELRSMGD